MVQKRRYFPKKKQYKQKKSFSKKEFKGIVSIAKKVVDRKAETKIAWGSVIGNVRKETFNTYNVVYQCGLTQGTGSETSNLIGNQFNLKGIALRGSLATSNAMGNITLALIMIDPYYTTTSINANDMVMNYVPTQYPPRFDLHKAVVLWKKQYTFPQPALTGNVRKIPLNVYYKCNHNRYLSSDQTGTYDLKGKNYYWVFMGHQESGVAGDNYATVTAITEMFYKDL